MANRIRTIDFLPEIFRTETNKQFLGSTLDQLVQEPKLKATQGYIGRRVGPGVNPNDNYIVEPTVERSNYQLEPGLVFLENNTNTISDALTYPGYIDRLRLKGANVERHDRLFNSEFYSWDPFIDFDKFVNFGQYYWLPAGPDSVDVSSTDILLTDDFTVTRGANGYTFSDVVGTLPTITLVREGNYTFELSQTGNPFWIQSVPGADGTLPQNSQSSREVLGVTNNGEDLGTITFNVPSKSAQNFFFELTDAGNVDLVTSLEYNDINNIDVSTFLSLNGGIDGISDLEGRTLIFLETIAGEDGGWVEADGSTLVDNDAIKYGVWQIQYVYDENDENPFIQLVSTSAVNNLSKVQINYGTQFAGTEFWKTSEGYYEKVPLITANLDILYYQDVNNPNFFGVIKLVDQSSDQALDIDEILNSSVYTSPNGVVFTNGLKVQFEGLTEPASYSGNEYYVEGVGTQIKLIDVEDLITPESYTQSSTVPFDSVGYDVGGFDDTLNAPTQKDYLTLNRASTDLNAWTRSNRWFHIDVINATAGYNNTVPVIDNANRANRPILEFRAGLKLYNSGTDSIDPIDIIDFRETDAFSNINGTIGYSVDGYSLVEGTRIIFANDRDPSVRNKVYAVNFVKFDDSSDTVIDLQPADVNSPGVETNQTVVVISGVTSQGKTYYYNGSNWQLAQEKTGINQAPLFDVFDLEGNSFADTSVYPSTDFVGSKLFSYALGTGPEDSVLGQPLKYLTIANVGDIVFENNIYTDSFTYVDNSVSVEKNIDTGYIRQYSNRTNFSNLIGWQTSSNQTVSRQSFSFEYTGSDLILDVKVVDNGSDVPVQVFVDGVFILPNTYTYFTNSRGVTQITFVIAPAIGSLIEVAVVSETASQVAYYSVPSNLENNAINTTTDELTLGTIRNHYNTICQNIENLSGFINGANNTRDLGNIIPFGRTILQQSSPMTLLGTFLNDSRFDYFKAIDFAGAEYEKFKNLILDDVAKNDWTGYATNEILDQVLKNINIGKNENSPFYWTDMLPNGETYEETVYTVSPITTNVFDTLYSYNFNTANYNGILVYLNDEILLADGHEYSVATDGPRITINTENVTLNIGDVIKIREFTATYGSYVPASPTSLGLFKAYRPQTFVDNTYVTPTQIILGHDGSRTIAFGNGDLRDDVLLEFEKRVYNNIKVDDQYNPPINIEDVVPGQFRSTDYSLVEINEILAENFLTWVGTNKIPYQAQTYDTNNQFTYNYTSSKNKLDGTTLLGNWRGIYQYLYDTDSPHTRPWEMLGLTERPDWWEEVYGPAPYTSGNLVLWEDLRDGKIADPVNTRTVSEFARPQLLDIIPTDSEGNLLAPFATIVGEYDSNSFRKSWVFGDQGTVETAWRRSSTYVFALQRLLALTQPAKYFALFADRDAYNFNTDFGQYLLDNRFRIDPADLTIYGNGTAINSYINWIVDYNRILGIDSTTLLSERLENIDVRLAYRMAAFSDKQYLKIFTEKSSPNSLNSSLLLPDESYQLLLYKNPAFSELTYSSVMVQRTADGYTIFGYSTANPYFEIFPSIPNGSFINFTVGSNSYRIPKDFRTSVTRVPYGYTFTTESSVVDFLVSYGRFLDNQGMTFENVENNIVMNWNQMAQEFVYWAQSNWAVGSLINLNPGADLIKVTKENAIAESLIAPGPDNVLLNQNKKPLSTDDFVVERIDNTLTLRSFNNSTFNLLNARFTAYEHLIVLDNTSIFNDLIYDPGTGARQSRLLVNGFTTFEWNGTLDAQGFILNQDNVQEWVANRAYTKGEIVLYKNAYWSAAEIIPPSETFDFSVWIKSDYNKITKGLLPNIATKADLIRNYYDTNTANLERDADLLGFGLIGFRPRQYMQNLNLDDISQVNLYKQFLGTKGTLQAAEIFSLANLNKEVAEYEITENWAIQRATYGANANRSYFELRLLEENLFANPSTVSVIEPGAISTADQTVLLGNIWKQSYKINSTNILPTFTLGQPDTVLPSAGYVNFDDVDIKVFDFNDLAEIVTNLDEVVLGSSIWVAKSNNYDWNVYRTNLVPATLLQITDNLNGTCTFTFNNPHGLTAGIKLVIKYFDNDVDGAYEVASVPGIRTATIALSLPDSTTSITGIGVGLVLESVRVAQASDISSLSFVNQLVAGSRAWVDDDGTGHWAAYQKTDPFTSSNDLTPTTENTDTFFGKSIAQGLSNQGGLIGSPGYESNAGGVYTYNKANSTTYVETGVLSPNTTGLIGYGTSLSAGNTEYAVTGAPESLSNRGYAFVIRRNPENGSYRNTQCLVDGSTDSEFGYSVVVSADERWMYIGAPGEDKVYAYNKIEVQNQVLTFVGDGTTTNFDISDTIKIDDDSSIAGIGSQQIGVVVNNLPTIPNTTWVYGSGEVAFATPPNLGDEIRISRTQSKTYLPTSTTSIFSTEDLYTITDIYSFSVIVNNVLQRPFLDYTYSSVSNTITLTAGVTGTVIITSATYWKLVDTLTYAGVTDDSSTNPRFGHSISTTTDGRQIIIGSPNDDPEFVDFAGTVQIIDRSVERFQITDATNRTYTTSRTPNGPVTVKLNNTFLVRDDGYVNNGEYTVAGSTITIKPGVSLAVGDILEIETNAFELLQTIQSNNNQNSGKFGSAVVQCGTNCSVYIGMPNDSTNAPQSGSVDRWANQARLYGSITSTTVDPTLAPATGIRINNYDVLVSTPATWTSAITWASETFVINGSDIYLSLQAVPVSTAITDTSYWKVSSWVELYVNDINTADIPNVVASLSAGRILLTLANANAADQFIKLLVLPGIGSAWTDLGFEPYSFAQTVRAPLEIDYGHFGSSVAIDVDADTLVVGAPDSSAAKPTTFDTNTTLFDSGATEYIDILDKSGVVYTYDFLLSANSSAANPAKFVFGQQLFVEDQNRLDLFGTAVSYRDGVLLIGSPQDDLGDSVGDYGRVAQFNNPDRNFAWTQIYSQQDVVDIQLLNSVFTYNRNAGGISRYLDYIDPLQGKILGSARQNIDYLGGVDPAQYNVGTTNNNGQFWSDDKVGEIWWDTSTIRYIDYHQDSVQYKARRWGQLFPGSSVDIYQWIESDVPPANYTGEGTVFSTSSYVVGSVLNADGLFSTTYYFWVKGITSVATQKAKTLSGQAVAQYIENPRSSGIPYIAPIETNTVALYNCRDLISANDTVLHVEFDQTRNDDNVHVEYDLIGDGNSNSFLGDGLYRKMLDSFTGADTLGNPVPDVNLSIADKYGVQFRPRQSFFEDRFLALENYLTRANTIISLFPIAESKSFDLLNSEEPEPTSASGEWDKKLATYAELTYQNLAIVSAGYRYLVSSDETQVGLWTIYTVQADKSLLLTRVQNYDTKQYWSYIDWVLPGYNVSTRPVAEVATFNDLQTLANINEGDSVKITANSFGKFEIYQYLSNEWIRVVAEDSTIAVSNLVWDYSAGRFGFDLEVFDTQRFDQNPITETRQILRALNEEIFTNELLIYRNELLILLFEFILTEQNAPEWLIKTSLVDVSHKIRDLLPFQIYRRDNQDFVQDYINEVKPYHVKVKEFNLRYEGEDSFLGTLTDFDVPAYFDTTLNKFISPVLDENEYSTITGVLQSATPSTDPIWQTLPWNQWFDNYKLSLSSVTVVEGGSGYTVPPQVSVTGTATRQAVLTARINTAGEVIEIVVVDAGLGYLTTPVITISGGNGTGARVVPVMNNGLIRSFDTTIKFDRYEYSSSVVDWETNTKYEEGSLVRYLGKVYSVNLVADSTELDSGSEFDPSLYTEVDQGTLSGADRTIGLYDPDPQDPGRELALLIAGIDYPGVQVQGVPFNQNTGYDIGNFDITSFDNLDFGPEGLPTYSEDLLDVIYESNFTSNSYLGRRSTDINIDGSEFIDTYSSHAPEELVPGSNFDTLDLKVYTRPGSDWTGDGHGFNMANTSAVYETGGVTIDWSSLMQHAVSITVENISLGNNLSPLTDYVVNWPAKTVTIINGATAGDELRVRALGVGGGSQLFKESYSGSVVGNSLTIPVDVDEIFELFIVVNGIQTTAFSYAEASNSWETTISFDNTYDSSQVVTITAMGVTTPQKTWSTPRGEFFIYDGSTLAFPLTASLQGTNPINVIVYRNGFRLRPAESAEYVGDGSSAGPYYLPSTGGTNQGFVADNEVKVYVDNEEQSLAVDFTVSPWDGSSDRYVAFNIPPDSGSQIIVAVTTSADYTISDSTLTLDRAPVADSEILVVTFNDTSEQNILTQVFQGPTSTGITVGEGFDEVGFDSGTVSGDPGSFDYSVGAIIQTNDFDTGRTITNDDRLEVTLNGNRLTPGEGYTVDGTVVTIGGSILGPSDVLVITSFTMQVVPEVLNFRIFQDMLGSQKLLRLYSDNTTILTQSLGVSDDIIYVHDASLLSGTDIPENILGSVIINGEKITYRTRNTANNTLSGLRRGVAGTSIASHAVGSSVSDTGVAEHLPIQYQQTVYKNTFTGDGTTNKFIATNVVLRTGLDSTEIEEVVRVSVAGTLLANSEYSITQINPVEVQLVNAPALGKEVEVSIVQSRVMYAQGDGTASTGVALQEQDTNAVRFLKGDI